MAFKSVLPATQNRPKTENKLKSKASSLATVLSANFDFTTILLIGAFFQGLILLVIPGFWALLPTILVLLSRAFTTLAITKGWMKNPFMEGAIHFKTTAMIPDYEGEFSKEGITNNEKITILLLGLRINHPLGLFDPGAKKINDLNNMMSKALDAEAPDNGFLGQTTWFAKTPNGGQDILLISYWRRVEDVLKFSQGPTHKETWGWWEDHAPELKHIGISHEVFEADKAMYESIYLNFQPTRLGATSFFRRGDEMLGGSVPDAWISPLVDASRGKLRTSKGRLGWTTEDTHDHGAYTDEKQSFY